MYKYEHGGDIYSQEQSATGKPFVDFSANINPLGVPQGVKEAIIGAIDDCINYPDPFCRKLTQATAEFLGVRPETLFFGNGAADVLFRLAMALQPKRALLLAPTFADYEKALRSVNTEIIYHNLKKENDFKPTEEILDSITSDIDIAVICNPNNPTGHFMDRELMKRVMDKCEEVGCKLLIDECFMDFVDAEESYTMRGYLDSKKHLIILKAFTKTFAVPGVRLGYCMTGDYELVQALHEVGQDWNVSVLAQAAGIAALKEKTYLEETAKIIRAERAFLKTHLAELGIRVFGSNANYIFFEINGIEDFAEQLKSKGFLIRSCANYHNLGANYYRIAVKAHDDNRDLITAIKEIKLDALSTHID